MRRILSRLGLDRPQLRAWAMYDWANSAFQSTIITAVFPPFFVSYAAAGLDENLARENFAWATAIAIAIIAVMGPVLGALADYRAWKKRLLAVFVIIGVAATFLFMTIEKGAWIYAAALFMIANIGVAGSLVFYDSLLPHIAAPEEIDRVSTAGYAIGYIGGGLLLLLNLAWIQSPTTFGLPDQIAAIKVTFVSVAVWWAVFSIPLFRRVPEPKAVLEADEQPRDSGIRVAFTRVGETFQEMRGYRNAFMMLVAFLLYNDGIATIIRMATLVGDEIGIDTNAQIAAIVMVQFVGIPCAFMFGALADRVGPKRALFGALIVYTGISILGYFMTEVWHFFVLAFLVAIVQGGSQALSRSLFARMIPSHKSSEFFGFFSVFEKFAGVFGPVLFGLAIRFFGSSRVAILSVIVFFAAGALFLTRVNVAEGEAEAAAASPAAG